MEAELKDMGLTWGKAESLAKDRSAWRLQVSVHLEIKVKFQKG